MDSKNQNHDNIGGALFVSEFDCTLVTDLEVTEVPSNTYDISSRVFSGAQGRSIVPIKLEMEDENDMRCKQFKLMAPTQQCIYLSVPENLSPLGLTLRKTPSFLDLVETQLSCSNASFSMPRKRKSTDDEDDSQQINGKTKASNFSCSLLQIGSWERVSRYDGELVAKFYFAKRKLVWEILDGGLKNKMEVPWSDIASIKATCNDNSTQTLEIELLKRPLFFRETNPQPRKHTLWRTAVDFTGGQASIFRRHFLQFPRGTLQKHYEKLLHLDDGLALLSKKPYPSLDSPFFGLDNVECQNQNENLFGFEGCSTIAKQMIESVTSDEYSGQLHCFTLSRTTIPQKYTNLDHSTTAYDEISSSSSGASGTYLGHEMSSSPVNMFPGVLDSLPPSVPNLDTPEKRESYCHFKERIEEVKAELLGNNVGGAELHQGKLNSSENTSSTFDLESNCWILGIETDPNLVGSSKGIGLKSEIDNYFDGFSCFGERSSNLQEEIHDNCDELLAYISETNVSEVFEWT